MNWQAYLDRIGCEKESPSASYLARLILGHRIHVPFENLDFYYQNESLLSTNEVFNKLVTLRRGGYQVELNWLFAELLQYLGFEVSYHFAVLFDSAKKRYSNLEHYLFLKVSSDQGHECWVDVGVIQGWSKPMSLDMDQMQLIDNQYFKLEQEEETIFIKRSLDAFTFDSWIKIDGKPVLPIEFLPSHQRHHEQGVLTENRFLYRRTPHGFIYLKNHILSRSEKGELIETTIENESAFWSLVEQHFFIKRSQVFKQEDNS